MVVSLLTILWVATGNADWIYVSLEGLWFFCFSFPLFLYTTQELYPIRNCELKTGSNTVLVRLLSTIRNIFKQHNTRALYRGGIEYWVRHLTFVFEIGTWQYIPLGVRGWRESISFKNPTSLSSHATKIASNNYFITDPTPQFLFQNFLLFFQRILSPVMSSLQKKE